MTEAEFQKELSFLLQERLSEYKVTTGENLIYNLIIDSNQKIQPTNYLKPARSQFAYQTDILIKKDQTPLVIIELKWNGVSTHHILTYSTKALKHKEVFPHLRYGLIVGKQDVLDWKLFVHNKGFDFSYNTIDAKQDIDDIVEILKAQILSAESLLSDLEKTRDRPKGFSSEIKYYGI